MKTKQQLNYGDRIYAKLCFNGTTITEFIMERISDMTELIGELRNRTRRHKGLAQLYVRNMTRGWSPQRPIMLYPSVYPKNNTDENDYSTKPFSPGRIRNTVSYGL